MGFGTNGMDGLVVRNHVEEVQQLELAIVNNQLVVENGVLVVTLNLWNAT
jgi:hypothetical protein